MKLSPVIGTCATRTFGNSSLPLAGKAGYDMADTVPKRDLPSNRSLLQNLLDDRLLLSAFMVCVLLIGYQLTVTLIQPPWIQPVTSWLRAALAWPQLLVAAWVAWRLLRTHQPGAAAWSWVALGMLSYAVARTSWTIADVLIYPQGVPFPSLPDLFFILQYPCFVAALFLSPIERRWLPGVRTMLDGLLWMSSVTALIWYFVLVPTSLQTHEPPLSKSISIFYQVVDLVLFYGLVVALARPWRTTADRLVLALVGLAVISLFVADTWAALLMLHPPHTYRTGSPSDLFWFTCYLLIPLAGLVRLRLTPAELPPRPPVPAVRVTWRDVLAGLRFVSPSVAVVGAGVLIIVHATVTSPSTTSLSAPEAVGIALLLLATLRPAVMFLEQEQLRRERDVAHDQESALRLANERMEAFLSMVAHELKTPLTSLIGYVQLIGRRLDALLRPDKSHENYAREGRLLLTLLERCEQSLERMERLVEDVLDETRVHQSRLALRLEPCDLATLVGEAAVEQAALYPERVIRWVAETSHVPVVADASRIEQVVANFVSNAVKFSGADQVVEVRLRTQDGMALVSVHDDGVGIPLADQPHIWERFYQAAGADVQHGSRVGFGVGLFISRAIVEGHYGQVGIESAPGQGTTIWFTLPLAKDSRISPEAPPMEPERSDPSAAHSAGQATSAHMGEAQSQMPPPGRNIRQPWLGLKRWFQQNTFAPRWLLEPLRHPLMGYLVAVLLQLTATAVVLLLLPVFPSFAYLDVLTVAVVVLVALGWGAGPGLFATLVGTLLLYNAGLPPHFTWDLTDPADTMGLLLYVVAGVCVSVLASRSERRRRQAEELAQELVQAEAKSAHDYRRLRAVLDAMPSAVVMVGPHGQIEDVNAATRTLWGGDVPLASNMTEYAQYKAWWAKTGQPVASQQWAAARVLTSGVAQLNDEMEIKALDGQHKIILNSAVPVRDGSGAVVGAVVNAQDISELRRLEQRTRDTLNGLVAIGEAIVQVPAVTTDPAPAEPVLPIADTGLPAVARRVAELTRGVLGCRRVCMGAIDVATKVVRPITVVRFPPAQEQAWWASFSPPQRLDERLSPAIAEALRAGERVYLDTASLPDSVLNVLFQARTALVIPTRMGEELVGALLVDYGEHEHDHTTPDEVRLTTTIARLGALVLERDRLLRQWTEARANELALRATTERMDTFLGIATHELKAPLAAIQVSLDGTAYRLRKEMQRQAAAGSSRERAVELFQEHLARTQQQVEQMDRLVNDLMDASRVQAGKLEIYLEACDLAAIVQRDVDTQRQLAPDRTIDLQLPATGHVPVLAGPGRIEQVMTNYLTNALKYSPSDRPVEVGVQTHGQQARVWVRDQGPGLPEEEHGRIWERFHRAEGIEIQSGTGIGLGLGLRICRTIVERHQGTVGVESAPGTGSTFWFTLPLAGGGTAEPDVPAP